MSTPPLALVADVGGTNARFALTDLDRPHADLQHTVTLPNADFASLQHAIEHYLDSVGVRPRVAAIAVACPVDADEIRLTNRAWSFSRRELATALGFDRLHLLNDFGAVAWAIPGLAGGDLDPGGADVPAVLRGRGGVDRAVSEVRLEARITFLPP